MRALVGCSIAAVVSAAFITQPFTPRPFERFTPSTIAQALAITPKGGWTYIVGTTNDPHYPTTAEAFDRTCGTDGDCNPVQGRFGPVRVADVVLTVFDDAGEIRYSTFIGGAGQDDNPRLAITRDGTLWLAGNKTSAGFQNGPECNGGLWIARFEFTLRRIEQFICLAGSTLSDIALDADGTLWILAMANGRMPTTPNAFQPNHSGQADMFVAQVSPSQATPIVATHIGGDRLDIGSRIAITPSGDIAIVGRTNSTNFPLVRPLKTVSPPSVTRDDAAILVMDRSGRFLEFSTYWGGSFDEGASGFDVDAAGNLFVTGLTGSPDMPTTSGAFDTQCAGSICRDAFVVKINAIGELLASTFLGGSGVDGGRDVSVRSNGDVLVLGFTQSADFPLVGGAAFRRWTPAINFEHTWLATFDAQLERLARTRFVGSDALLPSNARFVDRDGFVYVAGQVGSLTGAPAPFGNYLAAVQVP